MRKQFAPVLLATALLTINPLYPAVADSWAPRVTERLMKLPGNHLEKAVNNDFARSALAAELTETDEKVSLKKGSLEDLQGAIEMADGETRLELQYQFLAEKKRYLELTRRRQDIRKRRALTKVRLYERILRKMSAKQAAVTPAQTVLLDNQRAARERFEASLESLDTKLFKSSMNPGSKYGREYARNMAAVENLVQAINAHPMNKAPEVNGHAVTQADYLRQLIAQNEAEIALVDQERAIVGYMAKLVSLDALALSDGVEEGTIVADASARPDRALTADIHLFISR